MQTEIMKWFDMEAPVFAFSHCRDVVAAVSRNGGVGCLGTTHVSPEQLELDLKWIDEHTGGRPYGVDVMFASKAPEQYENLKVDDVAEVIPVGHVEWLEGIMNEYGVPKLSEEESRRVLEEYMASMVRTHKEAERRLDVVYRHPLARMIVSALGVPPRHQVERAHELGLKVGAMVGQPKHVKYQKDGGVDFVVAAGYEAAGHNSDVATFVLTPQIVEAAGDMPVLHAGGVARGRQIAAALALGAQGVWTGTIWLGTSEAETSDLIKRKIFAADSSGTTRSKCGTGKETRRLTTGWTEAWERDDAPKPLGMPLQSILINEALYRMDKYEPEELVSYPAGQGVGMMHEQNDVRGVIYDLMLEFGETMERLSGVLEET